MAVPPGNMAGTYEFTRMSTSHFMTFWKEDDVYSVGLFADATWSGRRRVAVRHRLIHASRLVREAVSRLMCSRKGHMLNFFQ